jgi:hypothetical protein
MVCSQALLALVHLRGIIAAPVVPRSILVVETGNGTGARLEVCTQSNAPPVGHMLVLLDVVKVGQSCMLELPE